MSQLTIIKSSGREEALSYEKFKRSLMRTGLSIDEVEDLAGQVQPFLHDRMSTRELYNMTYRILKKRKRLYASRYALKEALRLLGPTGFPFEKLVARILQKQGYTTQNNQVMQGRCVKHEIDILAHKNNKFTIVECKFHNSMGLKSDVRIPLYTKARCEDIAAVAQERMEHCMLATNTQFTTDAIEYGECVDLIMLAWAYPRERGIEVLIEEYALYPITVLTSLKSRERQLLLTADIVLCTELIDNATRLKQKAFNISDAVIEELVNEAHELCRKA